MIDKKKVLLTIFSIVFVLGLFLVIMSGNIGEFFSRHYSNGGWVTYQGEVSLKTIPFMITGAIIALISGFGLVLTIIKSYL